MGFFSERRVRCTHSHCIGGTCEWAAPEQLFGEPVSEKSDVYSIALMLVALLEGLMHGTVIDRAVALRYKSRENFKLEMVKIIANPELVFNFPVPLDVVRVLRSALQFEQALRPSMQQLRDTLVAFAQQPNALPAQRALLPLPSGFGNGQLYEHANGQFHWLVTDTQRTPTGSGALTYEPTYPGQIN